MLTTNCSSGEPFEMIDRLEYRQKDIIEEEETM
jgi:hypothetical protein